MKKQLTKCEFTSFSFWVARGHDNFLSLASSLMRGNNRRHFSAIEQESRESKNKKSWNIICRVDWCSTLLCTHKSIRLIALQLVVCVWWDEHDLPDLSHQSTTLTRSMRCWRAKSWKSVEKKNLMNLRRYLFLWDAAWDLDPLLQLGFVSSELQRREEGERDERRRLLSIFLSKTDESSKWEL